MVASKIKTLQAEVTIQPPPAISNEEERMRKACARRPKLQAGNATLISSSTVSPQPQRPSPTAPSPSVTTTWSLERSV
ncbi:uncharacterized protein CLUP02_12698 [Colletotrichum lupini]|uniref:Uncharacterized protein n=1 Tax=Colletotrichum lupini TaxID=145971 RepID=A0A9Q8T104_9PEZI|nr:uncharacterized protein CLUP02_12698 [Colletotrichum lupini]UQC87196.1 hypothetical protein CLUP02_12698 [Colletotrichum lupini]